MLIVKDALGGTQQIETLPAVGEKPKAASLPVTLSPENLALLDGLEAGVEQVRAAVAALAPFLDGLEAQLADTIAISAASLPLPAGAATSAGLEAVRALLAGTLAISAAALPLPAGAATEAKVEAVRALLAGTLAVSAAALPLPAGAATSAKQDAETAAVALVGTRAYGTPLARVAVASASAQSAAIAATEVLVHASTRCFIAVGANPAATTDGIPLEAGEKFHLRLTSGHKVAVLRDTADGFLNIVPVV